MIHYKPTDHDLRRAPAVTWSDLRRFLERCTDCTGIVAATLYPSPMAHSIDQLVEPRRGVGAWDARRPSTLAAIGDAISTFRAAKVMGSTLSLEFLLRDPATGDLLPYRDDQRAAALCTWLVFTSMMDSTLLGRVRVELHWPYDDHHDAIVRICDALQEATGIELAPSNFRHDVTLDDGTVRQRPWAFLRRPRQLPPPDLVRALLAAIQAAPDEDGPRLAYADLLSQHDEPLGELIAIQCELARLPDGDARSKTLARRETALLKRHRHWAQVPHLAQVQLRRGFVEAALVADVDEFLRHAETIFAAAPLLREITVFGRSAHEQAERLRRSAVAARLRAIHVRQVG